MEKITINLPGSEDFFVQEAYKTLRTNLQFCGQDIKVIAFTSCGENEGKSTISLHTAKSLAEQGKRVLLIDADMRKSVMAGRNAKVQRVCGLCEILTGMKSVSDCLYTTQFPTLDILFSGKYPPNPVELLGSVYFSKLVKASRDVYDYIIIDTPPLGMVIDAAVIAQVCDGTVLVMSNGMVRYGQAKAVIAQLEKSGSKILGVVRNHTGKPRRAYYGKK